MLSIMLMTEAKHVNVSGEALLESSSEILFEHLIIKMKNFCQTQCVPSQQCSLYLLSTHRSNHSLRQSLELSSLLELNAFANSSDFTEASYPEFCF